MTVVPFSGVTRTLASLLGSSDGLILAFFSAVFGTDFAPRLIKNDLSSRRVGPWPKLFWQKSATVSCCSGVRQYSRGSRPSSRIDARERRARSAGDFEGRDFGVIFSEGLTWAYSIMVRLRGGSTYPAPLRGGRPTQTAAPFASEPIDLCPARSR